MLVMDWAKCPAKPFGTEEHHRR